MLGRLDKARAALEHVKSRIPGVTIETTRYQLSYKLAVDTKHFLDALRKAGLPE